MINKCIKMAGILYILLSSSIGQANTLIMINTPPVPYERSPMPSGYQHCEYVPGMWERGVWVPPHRVCYYGHHHRYNHGNTWVEGHWRCDSYYRWNGQCRQGNWTRSHWGN